MSKESPQEFSRRLRSLRFQIGQNIHRRRSELRLPLTECAERIGLSPRILDQYEMGKREIELGELLRIAHTLRVHVRELI